MAKMQESVIEYTMTIGKGMEKYEGRWIGIVDKKIVANGDNAKKVFDEVKKNHPKKVPFVMKIPSDGVMLL